MLIYFSNAALGEGFIITDREKIQLNPEFPCWVDIYQMEKQAKAVLSRDPQTIIDPNLYCGDLLQDFYDEWILQEREYYRTRFVNALLQFARSLRTEGE